MSLNSFARKAVTTSGILLMALIWLFLTKIALPLGMLFVIKWRWNPISDTLINNAVNIISGLQILLFIAFLYFAYKFSKRGEKTAKVDNV